MGIFLEIKKSLQRSTVSILECTIKYKGSLHSSNQPERWNMSIAQYDKVSIKAAHKRHEVFFCLDSIRGIEFKEIRSSGIKLSFWRIFFVEHT